MKKAVGLTIIFLLFYFARPVWAHQPSIVEKLPPDITTPEISRAFYDELFGMPQVYTIKSKKPFSLYVNLLVPKTTNPGGRYSARVYKDNTVIAFLDGQKEPWTEFYEEFGKDYYKKGPEWKQEVPEGTYKIEVFSKDNKGKYVLAIGEKEDFPLPVILQVMHDIPILKTQFFHTSPMGFATSVFGISYIVLIFLAAFAFGFLYRFILKKMKSKIFKKQSRPNIGGADRFVRLLISFLLFMWGINVWNPWIFFFSGFTLFEAIFSWCALYALLGKNTCDL